MKRVARRLANVRRAGASVALGIAFYAVLVVVVWSYRDVISPIHVVMAQTIVLALLIPSMMYGAISGERERRSWDLLLVAPVTKAQVVVGKFLGAVAALGIAVTLILVPCAISFAAYKGANLADWLEAEMVSITFCLVVCAVTMFFSARCKRGLTTLAVTLAIFFGWLAIFPLMLGSAHLDPVTGDLSRFLDPTLAIQKMWRPNVETHYVDPDDDPRTRTGVAPQFFGFPQALIYIGLAVVFLVWAENTLRFADGEATFLPRSNHA